MLVDNLDELIAALQEAKEHYVSGKSDVAVNISNKKSSNMDITNVDGFVWNVDYDNNHVFLTITDEKELH